MHPQEETPTMKRTHSSMRDASFPTLMRHSSTSTHGGVKLRIPYYTVTIFTIFPAKKIFYVVFSFNVPSEFKWINLPYRI